MAAAEEALQAKLRASRAEAAHSEAGWPQKAVWISFKGISASDALTTTSTTTPSTPMYTVYLHIMSRIYILVSLSLSIQIYTYT